MTRCIPVGLKPAVVSNAAVAGPTANAGLLFHWEVISMLNNASYDTSYVMINIQLARDEVMN
jgi:hypothetical protein